MNIGAISISPTIDDPTKFEFDALYEAVGKNVGNYMFTEAVYRQLAAEVSHIGFHFDPAQVNSDFDMVVVPAANWLNARSDWDWLCNLIEKIDIPVVTLGLGVQAESSNLEDICVTPSALRLARLLGAKGRFISTRGSMTTHFLNSIGVVNAVTTGCPSLYLRQNKNADETGERCSRNGVAVQSTRYGFHPAFAASADINRQLFEMAATNGLDMIYQSEPEEIEYLIYGEDASLINAERVASLAQAYGLRDTDEVKSYLKSHGKTFFRLDDWSTYIRSKAGVLGTRLHGTIMALNSGVPGLLIAHDSRTSELQDFACIPAASLSRGLQPYLEDACFSEPEVADKVACYEERRSINGRAYRAFLAENLLPFDESTML